MAYQNLLESIFWMVYYILLSPKFNYHFIITDTFASWSFVKK